MSTAGPAEAVVSADVQPGALLLGGLRRGALLVFLPVFLAGQALAWITYAASGWYHPWSWFKIGLAEAQASVRVPFTSTETADGLTAVATLQVAMGALTVAALVLAFRAGGQQARGLEKRPTAATLAGSAVGLGFALPMFVAAFPITLGFPQFGIDRLQPVLWQAFALPLVVGGATGAVGAVAAARERIEEASPWAPRLVAAARGGAAAFWWGIVLSFIGFLALAAVSSGPTGAYARFVGRTGGSGAATVIMHAVLLPNQSTMILAVSMGDTAQLSVAGEGAVEVDRAGVRTTSEAGSALAAYVGAMGTSAEFPSWYALFLLVPVVAGVLGGRAAGSGVPRLGERLVRGAMGGVAFAVLCGLASWGATLVVPTFASLVGGSVSLGTSPLTTAVRALAWGVAGGLIGGAIRWPKASSASAPR
ncbi:MAG: hypothetical protein ABJB55_08920 [Actinomycetota bacterium]